MSESYDILYYIVGAVVVAVIILLLLITCLCRRRKRNKNQEALTSETGIKDDILLTDDTDAESLYASSSLKKKKKSKKRKGLENESPPLHLSYEPGTMIEGVYERISSADLESKYFVSPTCHMPPNEEQDGETDAISAFPKIGRSNSFNPNRRERPIVRKSSEYSQECEKLVGTDSIKLIETDKCPDEISDIKSRLADICTENSTRLKQKKISQKGSNKGFRTVSSMRTHEDVKISMEAVKGVVAKKRKTEGTRPLSAFSDRERENRPSSPSNNHKKLLRPLSAFDAREINIMLPIPKVEIQISTDERKENVLLSYDEDSAKARSVISSNSSYTSDATSNLDSGYDDINYEHSPIQIQKTEIGKLGKNLNSKNNKRLNCSYPVNESKDDENKSSTMNHMDFEHISGIVVDIEEEILGSNYT